MTAIDHSHISQQHNVSTHRNSKSQQLGPRSPLWSTLAAVTAMEPRMRLRSFHSVPASVLLTSIQCIVRVKYSLLVLDRQRSHVKAGLMRAQLFESQIFSTDSLYSSFTCGAINGDEHHNKHALLANSASSNATRSNRSWKVPLATTTSNKQLHGHFGVVPTNSASNSGNRHSSAGRERQQNIGNKRGSK